VDVNTLSADTLSANTLLFVVVLSLVSAGLLALGLLIGYWRGAKRGKLLSSQSSADSDLDKLAGFGRAILSVQLRLDALCEIVYQQSTRIVDTRNFQLGLFDEHDYAVKVWIRNSERLAAQQFSGAADEGLIGWVHKTAQGLRVGDYTRDWESLPAKPTYEAVNPPRSALFAPLVATGHVIGVIAVQSDEADAFTDEDLRLLNVLANQAAGALRNAQLFEQTRDRADQLRLINEISRQITAIQPMPDLLRQIVTAIRDSFHFYAVSILLYDPITNLVKLGASSHEEFAARNLSLLPGQGMIGWTYANARTRNAPDVAADPFYQNNGVLQQTRSEIDVPLIVENRVLGVLDVQSDRLNAFNPDAVFTLESLAGQLALALQEAQTYQNERRQAERVNAMAEASRAVVSILNIDELLDEVVDLVTDYFGYDRVHLFLRSGERVVFRSGSGVHSGKWAIDHLAYGIDDNGFIACVARNGQPLVSGEVFTDVHYVPGPGVEDTRSEMAVPIRIGLRVLGVFDVQSVLPDAFHAEDVTLMQALADTVAIGLRNATLFASETRRRMLAETLREVSMVIASSLDLESVLDGILQGLERVVGSQAALIALIDEDGQHYTVNAVRGSSDNTPVIGQHVENGTADSATFDSAMFDLLHKLEPPAVVLDENAHNHLVIPLQVGGETIGYLAIDRVGNDPFSSEEVEIINTFAGQAAIAIANAQLYMAQREEAWVSTALLQVAEATGRSTNLDDVLSTVARITPMLVGVEWCAVFLYENGCFRIVEIEGVSQKIAAAFKGFIFRTGDWEPLERLRQTGQPVMLDGTTPQPISAPMHITGVESAVLLPLYAKGEVMGALLIGQQDGADPLTDRKIELVSGIANQAALAIEGAQLFAAQQEEQWVTTALLTVAESVNSTLDLAETLETLIRLTPMLVGVSRCGVLQWDQDAKCFLGGAVYGLTPQAEKQFAEMVLLSTDGDYVRALAISTDAIGAGEGMPYNIPPALRLFDVPTLLGLPLIAKGTLVGAMLVDYPGVNGIVDQRRMNILTGTAQQAAMAIETARLQTDSLMRQRMERELEVAQGIQRSFLPQQLPTLSGWDLSVFYRAARQVGGDFYDFIPLRGGKWGIVIADVADKGVPAALFMVLCRTNLRASAFSRDEPVETLIRVNELLLSDSRSDLFVTCWYGVFDPQTGEIAYANGGHNPPLIIRADGMSEELTGQGIALGVIDTIRIEERRVTLRPGDTLLAYTDGITEAIRSDNTEFGVVGLQSTVVAVRQRPAGDMMKRIVQAVDTFTAGEPQFDDLTFIVLKREPESPALQVSAQSVDGRAAKPDILSALE